MCRHASGRGIANRGMGSIAMHLPPPPAYWNVQGCNATRYQPIKYLRLPGVHHGSVRHVLHPWVLQLVGGDGSFHAFLLPLPHALGEGNDGRPFTVWEDTTVSESP